MIADGRANVGHVRRDANNHIIHRSNEHNVVTDEVPSWKNLDGNERDEVYEKPGARRSLTPADYAS
jgi:hypothetical protein